MQSTQQVVTQHMHDMWWESQCLLIEKVSLLCQNHVCHHAIEQPLRNEPDHTKNGPEWCLWLFGPYISFYIISSSFFFQLTNSFQFIGYEHAVMTALETAHPWPATMNDNHHMMMTMGTCAPQQWVAEHPLSHCSRVDHGCMELTTTSMGTSTQDQHDGGAWLQPLAQPPYNDKQHSTSLFRWDLRLFSSIRMTERSAGDPRSKIHAWYAPTHLWIHAMSY